MSGYKTLGTLAAATYSPSTLPGIVFLFDPSANASPTHLIVAPTGATPAITFASDAAGGSGVLTGVNATLDRAAKLLQGVPGFISTSGATDTELKSTTGGLPSTTHDHYMAIVIEWDSDASGNAGVITFGNDSASSVIGTGGAANGHFFWFGRLGGAAPGYDLLYTASPYLVTSVVGSVLLIEKVRSGNLTYAWINGIRVIDGVSDTGYSVPAGYRLGAYVPTLGCSAHTYGAWWTTTAPSASDLTKSRRYARNKYKIVTAIPIGDSFTAGFVASAAAHPYTGTMLSLDRAVCTFWNFGIYGQTSTQILARASSATALASDGAVSVAADCNQAVICGMGVNDCLLADNSANTVLANIDAFAALCHAVSQKYIAITLPSAATYVGVTAWYAAQIALVNDGIRARLAAGTIDGVVDIAADATLEAVGSRSDGLHYTAEGYDRFGLLVDGALRLVFGIV